MNPLSPAPVAIVLRRPKRERTRERIRAAACEIFLLHGYTAATMEQIAASARIGRSTLYTHFQDKNEIFAAIADDYFDRLETIIAALPGPWPSRRQIDLWLADFAAFALREPAPTLLVIHFSLAIDAPAATVRFGERVLAAFAGQLPVFATAMQPEQHRARARATAVLRELSWALVHHVETNGGGMAPEMLEVAADLLEQLVKGWF